MKQWTQAALVWGALLLIISGCGGEKLVPLEGTLTLDGKPLSGAKATFQRSEGPVNERVYMGETDADGHYTVKPSWRKGEGVIAGTYQVFLSSVTVPPDADELTPLPKEPVPIRYRDGSETIVVPKEGKTDANFDMKSKR